MLRCVVKRSSWEPMPVSRRSRSECDGVRVGEAMEMRHRQLERPTCWQQVCPTSRSGCEQACFPAKQRLGKQEQSLQAVSARLARGAVC